MTETKEETTTTAAPATDLSKEIDAAVEAASTKIREGGIAAALEPEAVEPEASSSTHEDDGADDEGDGPARDEHGRFAKKDTGEEAAPAAGQPTEGTIERAVKLGIPLAEAKQFPTEALLDRMCARIEGSKGGSSKEPGSSESAGTKGGEDDPADLLSQIPDLDPDVYDEGLVRAFAAVKGIARQQQATIAELRGQTGHNWLAAKLEGLKDITRGDQTKESAVREKFDVLKAGYRNAKKEVADDAVFSEAARLVLGSDLDKNKHREEAAGRRSGQRIQRPTGRRAEVKPDAAAEIAAMLDRKFGP